MNSSVFISVCVCTYKRPGGLWDLLDSLARQIRQGYSFEVIVVDNDVAQSALPVVNDFCARDTQLQVRYFVEPQQNIAFARNRTVAEARGDWLAFIDDDELAESNWLSELLLSALRFEADGVFGPVDPVLPDGVPGWIHRGKFFEKKSRSNIPEGQCISAGWTRTSNALIRASTLKQNRYLFDSQWGLTGGSDYHLFSEMLADGSYFVWSDQAIVHERVASTRANLTWLMKRSIRGGQIWADRQLILKGRRVYFELIARAIGAFGVTLLVAPLMLPFGVHRSVKWLQKGAHGLGFLVVISRYRYEPYRA